MIGEKGKTILLEIKSLVMFIFYQKDTVYFLAGKGDTFNHSYLMWRSHQPRFHPDLNRGPFRERVGVVLSAPIRSYHVLMSICQTIFPDQHDCLDYRDHRIRSYDIVTKRNKTHLIMFPNHVDRGRCWTRKTA